MSKLKRKELDLDTLERIRLKIQKRYPEALVVVSPVLKRRVARPKRGPKPGRKKPVYVDTPPGYGRSERPMRWLER